MEQNLLDEINEEEEIPSNELALFKASLLNILTQVSSAISLETFTDIFKDVPSLVKKPTRVLSLWKVLQQTMLENMVIDINEFISDEDLNTKFQTISQMRVKTEIGKNKVAWRPTLLSTNQYMRSYDMQLKAEKKIKLEEIAEKKEQRIQLLRRLVLVERAKAIKVSESVQRAMEQLKKEMSQDFTVLK